MKEFCYDVEIEPKLQPLEGETFVDETTTTEDEARIDIKANGLWDSRFRRTFFNVKIFNPLEHVPKITTKHKKSMNLKRNSNTSPEP